MSIGIGMIVGGSRGITGGGQRLDDPAQRRLVRDLAPALDIEIARLDPPARREFGQIHADVMLERAPLERKPVAGQSVPWGNQRPPEPLSTGISLV